MQRGIIKIGLLFAGVTLILSCASERAGEETSVAVGQLSEPARAMVDRLTVGGKIEKIDREKEHGRVVYDVEATVKGKHVEYVIADSNGEVLGTENEIELAQLPEPVRMAAERYFGTSAGLKAMKGEEYGKMHYEIEGPKNGRVIEVTFDPNGKRSK